MSYLCSTPNSEQIEANGVRVLNNLQQYSRTASIAQ